MTTIDELIIQISADTKQLRSGFTRAGKIVDRESKRMNSSMGKFTGALKRNKIAILAVTAAITALGVASVKNAGKFEQTQLSFEVMLGSLEKSEKLLKQIVKFTKETPFELKDTLLGAKRLLAYGIEADKVVGTLEMLGNAASGLGGDTLPRLIRAFGQVSAKTRLMGDDLKQINETGLPIIEALAVHFNVAKSEISAMVSAGKVGFSDLEAAMVGLTSGNGKFANLMERQSKTFLGVMSNIQDSINIISIGMGQVLLPMLTKLGIKLKSILSSFENMNASKTDKIRDGIKKSTDRIAGLEKQINRLSKSQSNSTNKLALFSHDLIQTLKSTATALGGGVAKTEAFKSSTDNLIESLAKEKALLVELNKELALNKDPTQGPMLGFSGSEIDDLRNKVSKTAKDIKKFMNESTDDWSTNFADSLLDMGNGLQSFADLAKSIFRDIAREMIKTKLTTPLIEQAVSFLPGGTTSPTSPGASAPSSSLVATPSPTLSSRAPQQSQQQNITINQTIQPLTGIDESQVSRIVAQQAPAIVEQAKAGTLQAIKNGGSARSVVRGAR